MGSQSKGETAGCDALPGGLSTHRNLLAQAMNGPVSTILSEHGEVDLRRGM